MYYVYVLLLKNKQLYKGSTDYLRIRVADHKAGKVKSTQYRRPLKLIHYEAYLLKSDALRRERFLKKSAGIKSLKRQIGDILKKEGVI